MAFRATENFPATQVTTRISILGRTQTAAMSNEEISAKLALEWLWYGHLLEPGEVEKMLANFTVKDLAKAVTDSLTGVCARLQLLRRGHCTES